MGRMRGIENFRPLRRNPLLRNPRRTEICNGQDIPRNSGTSRTHGAAQKVCVQEKSMFIVLPLTSLGHRDDAKKDQ